MRLLNHPHLDSVDLKILDELQHDGSLSNVELARRVYMSPSPCLVRVKALEVAHVTDRYVAIANESAANCQKPARQFSA